VQSGLSAIVELTVADGDTAASLHSGDVPMLGTPRVVALVEEASCAALASGDLDPKMTSVGMRVELSHLVPIPVGRKVRAEATLDKVEGRRLTFTVSVMCDQTLVAVGKVTRVVVNRQQFIEKAG
jgi:predicted thioesterase